MRLRGCLPIWFPLLASAALLPGSAAVALLLGGCTLGLDDAPCASNAPSGPPSCPHNSPHSHTYGIGGSALAHPGSAMRETSLGGGTVIALDLNPLDCDGDGVPGDFDGDFEWSAGGAFIGYGSWADESVCRYGLQTHGPFAVVHDIVLLHNVWFLTGADDTSGPTIQVDPSTGETTCTTDGTITPGDPVENPTADEDDCLSHPQNHFQYGSTGETCGYGGDGGYWVLLLNVAAFVDEPNVTVSTQPTVGTITA